MKYTSVNGYLIPNLTAAEQPKLGRYGRMRREYLRQNAPLLFEQMLAEGTLYQNLYETEKSVRVAVEQTLSDLLAKNPAPNRQTNPLGWTQHMNSLKAQAEELALPMLYEL